MGTNRLIRLAPLLACGALLVAPTGGTAPAGAYATQYCAGVPIVQGIPPWGFHTGQPITGATGSYARGHGDYSFANNTVSGIMCQADRYRNQPDKVLVMKPLGHIDYHSHYATMWGVPGNIMEFHFRVTSSTDPKCKVGTIGHITMFGSYNNVRSDSDQFYFPKSSCHSHDHLYHGPQVNNQTPPL